MMKSSAINHKAWQVFIFNNSEIQIMFFEKYLNLFCRDNFRQYQNSYLSNLTIYNQDQIMN